MGHRRLLHDALRLLVRSPVGQRLLGHLHRRGAALAASGNEPAGQNAGLWRVAFRASIVDKDREARPKSGEQSAGGPPLRGGSVRRTRASTRPAPELAETGRCASASASARASAVSRRVLKTSPGVTSLPETALGSVVKLAPARRSAVR